MLLTRVARAVVLSAVVVVAAATVAAPLEDDLDVFLEGLDGYRAGFHQTVIDADGRVLDEVSGELVWAKPSRFRWDYREPYQQLIVADGDQIWIYDADLEQVTIQSAEQNLGGSPLALLEGRATLEESFAIAVEPEAGDHYWLRLTPLDPEDDFKSIRVGLDGGSLAVMEIHDAFGQVTTIELSEGERNPRLDDDLFFFEPPAGVDIIDSTR